MYALALAFTAGNIDAQFKHRNPVTPEKLFRWKKLLWITLEAYSSIDWHTVAANPVHILWRACKWSNIRKSASWITCGRLFGRNIKCTKRKTFSEQMSTVLQIECCILVLSLVRAACDSCTRPKSLIEFEILLSIRILDVYLMHFYWNAHDIPCSCRCASNFRV